MKIFLLATLLVVATSASLVEDHGLLFQSFKAAHGKTYKNQVEEAYRFTIFRENLRSIEEHNALYDQGLTTYKMKVTQFADMTDNEFEAYLGLHPRKFLSSEATEHVIIGGKLPQSVDWRKKGHVTPVKNQGECGSCWSFAITGTTEAAFARKNRTLVSLSEQQLVDCDTEALGGFAAGCNGGPLGENFEYIKKNGLQSEKSYPYKAIDGKCKYDKSKVVTKVSGYKTMSGNENALLDAVAHVGPVAVAIDANLIKFYASGIFNDKKCSSQKLNHGVLVVGYGSEKGKKFWIIKNSWGSSWGEKGYFRISRGINLCGIAVDTTYPVINK